MNNHPTPREVLAPNPSPMTLEGTRTYILGRERPVVIDPGPDEPEHIAAIEAALQGSAAEAILLTHEHPDHAAGAERLAAMTGAPIRTGRGALNSRYSEGAVEWVREGDEVQTDRGSLTAIATPGHTPEHLAYWWTGEGAPDGGAVFVGDLMMGQGDTTLVATPEGDLRDYIASLARIESLRPAVLYPAHGPPIGDPYAAILRYRRHRAERLEQVQSALQAHPGAGADRLVDLIYGSELDPRLREAAAGSVEAMLRYLTDR